ncbi:MAG: hypothetical protein C5B48_02735 [Candidatus Rokuibacteriota bacterium]|nr:MAG: hypothetical protein C5B48_02735 [Candidatus Rokubacteria bacterium]
MGSAGTYHMLEIGEGPGGGIMKSRVPSAPAHSLTYVKVDDVAMAAQKAQGLGAKVVQPRLKSRGSAGSVSSPTRPAPSSGSGSPRATER